MGARTPYAIVIARRTWGRPLPASFYNRDAALVARDLLGKVLLRRDGEQVMAGRIVETEAYLGEHDPACHAAAGKTVRNAALYGPPGTAYVYFIYGMHWCVNAVTGPIGHPAAVLLRAIEPLCGLESMLTRRAGARSAHQVASGPGNLCRAMAIDSRLNGVRLSEGALSIRDGCVQDANVSVTGRIGVSKAADWPLRFTLAGNASVSRQRGTATR